MLEEIDKFKNAKVLVLGDLMLDEYIKGEVNRISPEAPIPIVRVQEKNHYPGGAANTARNVRALGAEAILSGVIGPKEKGQALKEILQDQDINTEAIIEDEDRKTTVKSRVIAEDQQVVRIDSEDRKDIKKKTQKRMIKGIKEKIKEDGSLGLILIVDYAKGVVTPQLSKAVIKLAQKNDIPCLVDPKGEDFSKYKHCTGISPNVNEAALALDLQKEDLEERGKFIQAGKMLLSHLESDFALVTRHEKGMVLFKDDEVIEQPAINKKPRDISGAGDTATATFGLGVASGLGLEKAMKITNHACGVVVGKMGTATASPEEIKQSFKENEED